MGKKQTRMTKKNKRSDAEKPSSKFLSSLHLPKKKKTPSSKNPKPSSTTGRTLTEDLILDILSRLPVKSLLRFQSVCKSWHTIIHSPSFVDVHLTQSQTRPCGEPQFLISFSDFDLNHYFYSASLEGGPAVRLLSLPCYDKERTWPCHCYVSESVNGLVCFYNGRDAYVINPSTRSFRTLPESHYDYKNFELDDYEYYSSYSFGYDPSKNEYKVLHIMGTRHEPTRRLSDMQCEVLVFNSHDTNMSWRKITHVPPYPYMSRELGVRVDDETHIPPHPYRFREDGVCVDGEIHWICTKAPSEEVMVVFDVGSEKFRSLPLPDSVSPKYNLTKIGGPLALLNYRDLSNKRDCDGSSDTEIWVLEDCQKKWVQKTVVAPPKYEIFFPYLSNSCRRYQFIYWDHRSKASRPIRIGEEPFCFGGGGFNVSITNHVDSVFCLS